MCIAFTHHQQHPQEIAQPWVRFRPLLQRHCSAFLRVPHLTVSQPHLAPGSAAGSRSLAIQDAKSKPSHISEWTVGKGSSGSSSLGLHPFPSPTDYPRAQENPRRGDFSEELKAPTGKRERHEEQEDHGAENEEYVPCMALVVAQHYYIKNYSSKTLHIQSSGSK